MLNKKISFIASNKQMLDVWPHPKPASRYIPEEYKKLEGREIGKLRKSGVEVSIKVDVHKFTFLIH